MFKLIKGGYVYAPHCLGHQDILTAGNKIVAIGHDLMPPLNCRVEIIDAKGLTITPGLLDIHVHILGGGGEGGPDSRAPEIEAKNIFKAGVTTVVGMLGTDDVTRHPESLLAKAQGLEKQGVTTYVLAGSYKFPKVVTLTGDLRKDIALIPHVIGVGEIAIADHRGPQAQLEDLAQIASDARVAGLLGSKPGLVVVHLGGGKDGMTQLFRLVEETEIPITNILPTHVTRTQALLEQGIEWAKMGGYLDITTHGPDSKSKISLGYALDRLKQAGVDLECVSVSSDSNGSKPLFDEKKNFTGWTVGDIGDLKFELIRLIKDQGMTPDQALPLFTQNPAHRIGAANRKGRIALGMDADIAIWNSEWQLQSLQAGGNLVFKDFEII